jgi:hypothetical protein
MREEPYDDEGCKPIIFEPGADVVGAPAAEALGECCVGAAYVFVKPNGGWTNATEAAELTGTDSVVNDSFGRHLRPSCGGGEGGCLPLYPACGRMGEWNRGGEAYGLGWRPVR